MLSIFNKRGHILSSIVVKKQIRGELKQDNEVTADI